MKQILLGFALVGLGGIIGAFAAGKPAAQTIEPPSWWAGHPHNPVRLMFVGTNFQGAKLIGPAGFSISNVAINPAGTHAFADVYIPTNASVGSYDFKWRSAHGESSVAFNVGKPLPPADHFRGFSTDDVIYLLMPDRFANGDTSNDDPVASRGLLDRAKPRDYHGGDFQGVIDHLPYLRELGATALWLTPWYDNVNHFNTQEKYTAGNQRSAAGIPSTDYHGYGAVDFYAVEEHFGDLAKLQELVKTSQASGFKIIQDQVANHTGPYHPWVKAPPTPTWFNGTADQHLDNSWQTWTIATPNPPADKLKSTLEGWFINILPDLNQNDPEVATYLIQNSLWWVGMTGLDAIRQDTLPYVPRGYWSQWTTAVKKSYPQLTVLGEMFDAKPELVSFFQGGRRQFDGVDSGIDTLFDFPLYYAMRDVFAGKQPMTRLQQTLAADTNYVDARTLVTFLGLHDVGRFMNEPGATPEGLQLAFTFLFTVRGTPLIYYGDEIALRGGGDPDNRRDFPGGWEQDKRNAFRHAGRTAEEGAVHAHVKKLLSLRRELEPLRRGELRPLQFSGTTATFARLTPNAVTIVAFNNGAQPADLKLKLPADLAVHPRWFDRLTDKAAFDANEGTIALTLSPRTAVILTPQPAVLTSERGKDQARSDL